MFVPAIFLLTMKSRINGDSKQIAFYSSGVYLVHPFILDVLKYLIGFEGTLLTLSVFIIALAASYFLILANKRLNYIL